MLASFKHLKEAFDALPSPDAARQLNEAAILCGPAVGLRYYLGRVLHRNFFGSEDEEVSQALVAFVAKTTSPRGAALLEAAGMQGWAVAQVFLRYIPEGNAPGLAQPTPSNAAAIEALLRDPSLDNEALAKAVGTTAKQLSRMSEITLLRKFARVHGT